MRTSGLPKVRPFEKLFLAESSSFHFSNFHSRTISSVRVELLAHLSIFQAQLSARIPMITRNELLYQTADETPRCIIVRMPTPPSAGTLLARMHHRAIRLAHS